MIFGIY